MKFVLYSSAAALALAASPVLAQQAPQAAGDAPEIGEIVVTAQLRTERLQDVPVAISVVSGEAVSNASRSSLEGVTALVPSLNFVKAGTSLNQTLFLRGLGTTSFSIAVEPSVSTVLDGVVLSRAAEAFSDLADVARLEVLRGPQGTLFGRNASAGVINIVSVMPGDTVGGNGEVAFFGGNGNEFRARGSVDLPLSPTVRSRTTVFYNKYDGNIFNIAPNVNRRVNGFEHWGIRSILQADLGENAKFTLIGDYHKNDDDCCADVIGGPPLFASTSATPGAVNTTSLALIQTVLPALRGKDSRTINQNLITRTIETGYGFSGQLDAGIGDHTLTSITAYRNFANNEIRDGDFYPQAYIGAPQSHDTGPQTGWSFSQELRIASPGKQFIDYVAGAYYAYTFTQRVFRRDNTLCTALPNAVLVAGTLTPCSSPLAAPSTTAFGQATYSNAAKNLAFFAQATMNVSDSFRLIGGLRYTRDQLDEKFIRITSPGNGASQPPFDAGVWNRYLELVAAGTAPTAAQSAAAASTNGVPLTTATSANNVSGRAGLQYDFSREVMGYATYTRGYKGPAFNLFFNLQPTGLKALEPETSDAFEVGLKNTFMGGKLTVNVAGFYAKYHNFQANNPDTLTVGGVTATIARFTNAGTVSTRGFEMDMTFRPTRDFTLSGGAAYTDAQIDQFNPPPVRTPNDIVPNGTTLPFAPKFKGSLNADYRIRLGGPIDIGLNVQGTYQSSQSLFLTPDPVIRNATTIAGYGIVNAGITVMDQDDRYKLSFVVRNLFDTSYIAAISTGGPSGAYRYQIPRDADRYWGIIGRVNF